METLKSFIKDFAILGLNEADAALGNDDDMNFDVSSQDDDSNLDIQIGSEESEGGDEDELGGDCKCSCPCCDHGKDGAKGDDDDNIEIIDPEDDEEFDINAEVKPSDEDEDSDPTKDYNVF